MNLLTLNSVILNACDLKLSDTTNTFGTPAIAGGFSYKPLKYSGDLDDKQICRNIVFADVRKGVEISFGNKKIYYFYGMDKDMQVANHISIGYYEKGIYYILSEAFHNSSVLNEKPKISERRLITTTSVFDNISKLKERLIMYEYGIYKRPTMENWWTYKHIMEYIKVFRPAFSRENLDTITILEDDTKTLLHK